jgi:hypothetical protein
VEPRAAGRAHDRLLIKSIQIAHFEDAPIAKTVEPFPVELTRTERRKGIKTAFE